MGAPTSALISQIYLQCIEHTLLIDTHTNNNILGYFRYVDDILIVHNNESTNIDPVLQQFNDITNKLHFTIEKGNNNILNILDISIHRHTSKFEFGVYRKPTVTHHIIPNDSNLPPSHKFSAITFLTIRMNTYPSSSQNKDKEFATMKHMLHANNYKTSPYRKNTRHKQTTETPPTQKELPSHILDTKKRKITNIFQKLGLQIALKTKHTLRTILLNPYNTQDKFQTNGVYRLTCPNCNNVYIRQTGRPSRIRFKENEKDFHTKCNK